MASVGTTLSIGRGTGYGLDLGGTKYRASAHRNGFRASDKTAEYQSLEELLDDHFRSLGMIPASLVLALPGTYRNGRLEFTNLDWPSVTVPELTERYGVLVEIINDMQAAWLGAAGTDEELTILKKGVVNPNRCQTVLTLSTGVNWTTGTLFTELPCPREGGHIRLAVDPDDTSVHSLISWVSKRLQKPVSIENLLSGGQGVDHIADYLLSYGWTEGSIPDEIAARRGEGKDSAPLMTAGVVKERSLFWLRVAEIYGELLGYLINQIVVSELTTKLVIQGSVLNGTPTFAQWLFDECSAKVVDRLVSADMEKAFVAEEVRIFGVPAEVNLAAVGAERRAYIRLAANSG